MFKVENYKELVKAAPTDRGIWAPRTALIRDDGLRLDRWGSGREGQSYFTYTDSNMRFEFTAADRFVEGGDREHWDHWDVLLGLALQTYSRDFGCSVSLHKAKEIAGNIEEALLAWPRYPSEPAIRQVKFWMKPWAQWNPAWGGSAISSADIPEPNSASS
jgi:hypothetical protein